MSSYPDSPIASDPPGFVEQRLVPRKRVETPLPIELLPGKEVWLHDLGEGGLSVSGSSRLEPGTTTFLDFQFPDQNSAIEAAGVIAWCDDSGRVGVRFTRVKPDSTAALKRWLKSDRASSEEQRAQPAAHISPLSTLLSRAHFEISDLRTELDLGNLGSEAALNRIVERMARHTRATGAAIAWRDGTDVICRASVGNAPEIGVKLNLDASLSGECYRTGNIVSLADSEHDSRVGAELCRQLDFRSLLIVPVASSEEIIVGIAEVFSSAPGNFEGGDVLLLSSIAELIGELYDKGQESESSARNQQNNVAAPRQEVADLSEVVTEQTRPAQTETESAPFVPAGFELANQNSGENGFIATSSGQAPYSSIEHAFDQDRNPAQAGVVSSWKSRRVLLGTLLLAGGIGIGDYVNWRFIRPHSIAPRQSSAAVQPGQVPIQSLPQLDSTELAGLPQSSASQSSAELQPSLSLPNRSAVRKAASRSDSVQSNFTKALSGRPLQSDPVPDAPTLVSVSDRPAFRVDTTYFLPTKVPQAKLLNASLPTSQVTTGKLLHRVDPVLPQFARTAGIRGSVVIAATIGKDGRLKNMKLISGNGALAIEAFRAARQWVYAPYRLDGRPIEVDARIVINFGRQ